MTIPAHRRHDISDRVRGKIEHLLPGRKGSRGGIAQDNRRFVNVLFRIMRTGSPWRDLPPDYGGRMAVVRFMRRPNGKRPTPVWKRSLNWGVSHGVSTERRPQDDMC